MKKTLLVCTIIAELIVVSTPASAIVYGCGSSRTICAIRARNHWAARSRADANTPHRYCDALCQAKCDATSRNPQACYAKWQKINAAGRGRECEKANASGQHIAGC